ncbi:hypothetical protein RBB50_005388 [Rhinocladiella similis]
MSDTGPKKGPSIPAWQQKSFTDAQQSNSPDDQATDDSTSSSTPSELPLLEQARKFLEDESIRDASRDRKVTFLEQKGLTSDQIEQLLSSNPEEASASDPSSEIKTVHDTTLTSTDKTPHSEGAASAVPSPSTGPSPTPSSSPKRDIPPIITYPEFLLKPQKPPPLVTFSRLANAAYGFAGLATLTYAASTYIVEPMLETLTSARHDVASKALADLEQLNAKLESTVSHVPYIPPLASSSSQLKSSDAISETSSDSDPTELFHRDIATQTSPGRSRSPSLTSQFDLSAQDPTASQSTRLRSLHSTLSSLVSSTDSRYSQERLKDTMSEMQGVLDKMSNTYNPFQTEFSTPSFPGASYTGPGGSGAIEDKNKTKKASDNEAQKFRAEIRALKGAFLSSRNFPTARPAAPFAVPGAGR